MYLLAEELLWLQSALNTMSSRYVVSFVEIDLVCNVEVEEEMCKVEKSELKSHRENNQLVTETVQS